MKAVILAGGEGTRLRPLTCSEPKPMTRLLGKPVLEHILLLLKSQGIREAAITLCYMPEAIRSYFGDGSELGMELSYFVETEPLGTAGCVKACGDFVSDSTLIISGDAVCDFDFSAPLEVHRSNNSLATLLLTRSTVPLEYGLVMADRDGRVFRFIEKPSWERVCTDAANTGIYIIEPELLSLIPEGKQDFARDIFPKLLERRLPLYACESPGYWCDIGDCGAYLGCVRAALDGRVKLKMPTGVPVSALDAQVTEPVYIAYGAKIDRTAVIGPYAYIGSSACIEGGAIVTGSSVDGIVGRNARVCGAIICKSANVGRGSLVGEGCVIGEGAKTGESTVLRRGVRLWPDCVCADGSNIRYSVSSGGASSALVIEDGELCGDWNELTPQLCLALGAALGAGGGRFGIAAGGTVGGAELCAQALECGLRSAGADALVFPAHFDALVSYSARRFKLDLAVYPERFGDKLRLRVFTGDGLPLDGAKLRRLLSDIERGVSSRIHPDSYGRRTVMPGLSDAYCRAASYGSLRGSYFSVRLGGSGSALCNILWLSGARIAPPGSGCPAFAPSSSGFELEAADEGGKILSDAKTLACAVYIAAADGRDIAVPFTAPSALSIIARNAGVKLLRIGEDEDAERLWADSLYLRDGIHRAAYIAAWLKRNGVPLSELYSKLPPFYSSSRLLPLSSDRAGFMREAASLFSPCSFGSGIRADFGGGRIGVLPCPGRQAVRLFTECFTEEAAEELCGGLEDRLSRLDLDIKRQKSRP